MESQVGGPECALAVMRRARKLWPHNVRFSPVHATERMVFWRIQPQDIGTAIREGTVASRRFVAGEWRYRIEGPSADRDPIACVVAFEGRDKRLVVITAFRCRRRRREVRDEGRNS